MPKRVLHLASDRRRTRALDELLAFERVEQLLRLPARDSVDRLDRAEPENFADHRRVLEQPLLGLWKSIEAGGDDPLHRLREPVELAALVHEPGELLGVQRIPAGACNQVLAFLRIQCLFDEIADELRSVVVGQRGQRDGERVRLATSPPRPALQELWARGRENEQRDRAAPLDERVDEFEQCVVRPVQVFEHADDRPAFRDELEVATPRG